MSRRSRVVLAALIVAAMTTQAPLAAAPHGPLLKQNRCTRTVGLHEYEQFVTQHLRHGRFLHADEVRRIRALDRCLHGARSRRRAHAFFAAFWEAQHQADLPLQGPVMASWFDDSGATASGSHYANGFAALIFGSRWGLAVRMCAARCAVGHLEDHGPYVGGRTFDLGPALKAAVGCGDLCAVRYRVIG